MDAASAEFWAFVRAWQAHGDGAPARDAGIARIIGAYNSRPIYETTPHGPVDLLHLAEQLRPSAEQRFLTAYAIGLGIAMRLFIEWHRFVGPGDLDALLDEISRRKQARLPVWEARRINAGSDKLCVGYARAEACIQQALDAVSDRERAFGFLRSLPAVGAYRAISTLKSCRLLGLAPTNFDASLMGPGALKGARHLRKRHALRLNDAQLITELRARQPAELLMRPCDAVDIEHMLCYYHVWVRVMSK